MIRKKTQLKNLSFLLLSVFLVTLGGCQSGKKDTYADMDAQAIYAKARHQLEAQHFNSAIKDLDALEARHPFGEVADKAQLALIYAHYAAGDYASSAAASERFIQLHPRHTDVSYAYYMTGLAHFQESLEGLNRYLPISRAARDIASTKEAFFDFGTFLDRFPTSPYAPDAHQRMIYLRNVMAEHELLAAHFYYEKGAYMACLNRTIGIFQTFDKTPSLAEALNLSVRSYQALGLNDLADDSLFILQSNYARSRWAQDLGV